MFSIGHLIQILYITQIILILDNAYECLKYPLVSGENIYIIHYNKKGVPGVWEGTEERVCVGRGCTMEP